MSAVSPVAAPLRLRSPAGPWPVRVARRLGIGPVLAVVWLTLLAFLALFVSVLPFPGPQEYDSDALFAAPFRGTHLLGTNNQGNDLFSYAVHGARVSLWVGIVTAFIGTMVGGALGITAGYFGGRTDKIVSFVVDVMLSFPSLVLLLAIRAFLGEPTMPKVIGGLSLLAIPALARVARANTLPYVHREFVTASHALGATHLRCLRREILPNVVMPVATFAITVCALVITADGALAFLGVGFPKSTITWGGMILDGRNYLERSPHLSLVPCAFLAITVLSLTVLGDRLQRLLHRSEARI